MLQEPPDGTKSLGCTLLPLDRPVEFEHEVDFEEAKPLKLHHRKSGGVHYNAKVLVHTDRRLSDKGLCAKPLLEPYHCRSGDLQHQGMEIRWHQGAFGCMSCTLATDGQPESRISSKDL